MRIAPRVHLLDGTKGSYAFLVLGEEPVLVDTSFAGRCGRIVKALDVLGLQPTDIAHIALTHHDPDHIGNVKQFAELSHAAIWASKLEVPFLQDGCIEQGVRRVIKTFMKTDPFQVDRLLEPGHKVGRLEIVPTPGHTNGHVCFVVDDILLAGDLVRTMRGKLKPSPGLLTTDKIALQRSIQEVGKLPFKWVCPAHGNPILRATLWEAIY